MTEGLHWMTETCRRTLSFVLVSVGIYWLKSSLVFNLFAFESWVCYRGVILNGKLFCLSNTKCSLLGLNCYTFYAIWRNI